MAIIRVSIFTPKEGNDARVANLVEALDTALAMEAGYVLGLRFSGMESAREVGRIYVWEDLEAGQRAEGSPEASPLIRRIKELSEPDAAQQSYDLQGYALKPDA